MALALGNTGEFMSVRNPFNLQTQQKRLRHLRSISVRNLHSGVPGAGDISRLECYFTLHASVDTQAFYQSEKMKGSTNPSWQSFDISRFEDQIDLSSKFFVVRVWVGREESFRLLILMEVHLTGLHFLGEKLQHVLVKQNPNTVIFGMLDKEFVFINKDQTRVKNLVKKVSDLDLPSTLLPAVVKVEKSTVRNSYTTSSLTRIQTVLRAIKQMQAHARRYRRQIEDRLLASQDNTQKLGDREYLQMSVGLLRQDLLRRTTHLHQTQEKLQALREATAKRVETLKSSQHSATDEKQISQEDKREYIMKREQLVKENALLNLRRRQMLCELFNYIYPIKEDNGKLFISGVRLPHAEEFQGQDETMVAVGLGYSCHLTIKMSQILGLPLRHPMDNRGSKSRIYDQVHSKLAEKDREFPLFSKGKDKYHFNYGVFLLNKNISQLRFQCNMATVDLRQTLKNLLTLMHKLGIRMEGDTITLTATPEGTALSQISINGSSHTPTFPSTNGDHLVKAQESRSGHPRDPSKTSDLSEDDPSSRTKEVEEEEGKETFDESEEIFKPAGDEDHFFKVNNSLIDDFNALSIGRGGGAGLASRQPVEDKEADNSSNISGASYNQEMSLLEAASQGDTLAPKTFQLVKKSQAGNKAGNTGDSLRDNDSDANEDGDGDDENRKSSDGRLDSDTADEDSVGIVHSCGTGQKDDLQEGGNVHKDFPVGSSEGGSGWNRLGSETRGGAGDVGSEQAVTQDR